MPVRSHLARESSPGARWRRMAALVAGIALLGGVVAAPTVAQDGTSGAPPLEESACRLVPATPMEALLAGADPEAGATPVASPVASPVAAPSASPVASPVADAGSDALLEDLTAAATSLTSCLTEGRYADVADHTSPLFRGQLLGIGGAVDAETFAAVAAGFPEVEYTIREIGSPEVVDPSGTATAQLVWQVGHQVRVDAWTFVQTEVQGVTIWVIDAAGPGTIDPALDAESVEVAITGDGYQLERDTVTGDAVRFAATNTDATLHELLVVRLEGDAETADLLTTPGPALPEGITFIGQVTIAPDASAELLLVDLEPGRYAIVDLLPNAEGVPGMAQGMEASFTVE